MALKLRLSRGGRRNLPYYRIVVTDSRSPRDSSFIERLGTYNPLLAANDPNRVTLNAERIKHWLSMGAQPSDRVALFLGRAGIIAAPKFQAGPKKSAPKAKAQERMKEQEEAAKAKAEAEATAKAEADAAAAAPAEAPVEAQAEAAAETPAAEDAKAE
ncbi:MAG: 30S ribosomal protein S16 [Alphaproteobacteria bacterium]|nr:30S ribosomal protein S16 [Alphaproteobacteria bacterium]USO07458.1 MAG: 30S ribosomal protein S16 [Rhodospirillales bacterium]